MLLAGKVAVIYGGGGAIGSSVSRRFAEEGAELYIAGRSLAPLEAVAETIEAAGGRTSCTVVDALDEAAVERHASDVAADAGRIDIVSTRLDSTSCKASP